jgi:ribosomal protein S5
MHGGKRHTAGSARAAGSHHSVASLTQSLARAAGLHHGVVCRALQSVCGVPDTRTPAGGSNNPTDLTVD